MHSRDFFLLRYEPLHGFATDRLLAGLGDDDLRARPHGLNSIAWLLWHVARAEDIGVNRFVADGTEVFDGGAWQARLGVTTRELGTGMTFDEASALTKSVDVAALRDYWAAVGRRTLEVVSRADLDWDATVSDDLIARVVRTEGGYGPRVKSEAFYRGHNRGWFLAHLALTHSWGHLFEAQVVRSLVAPDPTAP